MSKKTQPTSFEQALADLENIVKQMEKGDMPLEESLAAFEKGVELTRLCQNSLKDAEQRVKVLMQKNGADTLMPFEGQDES